MKRSFLVSALLASSALLALPCAAAVLTVGPGGTHASIQSAISAAQGAPGDDEVRIRAGTYAEQLSVSMGVDKILQISGGWNAGFDARDGDPALTIIDGSASGVPLSVSVFEGDLRISHLSLNNGLGSFGGGAAIQVQGTGSATLSDCVIRDNVVSSAIDAVGGGVRAHAAEDGSVAILRCHVHGNTASSPGGSADGAGIDLYASDTASASLRDNLIEDNTLIAGGDGGSGAGLYANCSESAEIEVVGNRIEGNVVAAGAGASEGYGAFFLAGFAGMGDCLIDVRGNGFEGNEMQAAGTGFDFQLQLYAVGNSQLVFGDNLVAAGTGGGGGLWASAFNSGVVALLNLSIVDNEGEALRVQRPASAQLSLFNTLAFGNGSDAFPLGSNSNGNNLFGIDPLFAGPDGYRLSASSPARDAGASAPPGGLGSVDAEGGPRVVGPAVDIGAYEYGSMLLFADGFEG